MHGLQIVSYEFHKEGQSLIEVLIATAIGALMIIAAATVITPLLRGNTQANRVQVGAALARELADNLTVFAEGNWHNIDGLATTSINKYWLSATSSPFRAVTGTESIVISGNASTTYKRDFYIDVVNRVGGNIVTGAGTNDPSTKKITIEYSWPQGTTSTMLFYLTRYRNFVLDQTDWSGGPGQDGPATTTNSKFASSTGIDYTSSPGSISIILPGGGGGGGSASISRSASGKIFFDDFSGGLGNWTVASGTWEMVGGVASGTPPGGVTSFMYVTGQSQTDGVMEVKTKSATMTTGLTAPVMRAADGRTHYRASVMGAGASSHRIDKRIAGIQTILASAAFAYSANTFYDLRGYITSSSLYAWQDGASALSASDTALTSAGLIGLFGEDHNWIYDDFAFYTSPIFTLNNLPGGSSWSVRDSTGANISCQTGSTWDASTYTGQIPIDYDNGGGSVAVWASNSTCNGAATVTYPASGLATDIFGGDIYSYNP